VALVSSEPEKMTKLAKRHGVSATYSFDQLDACPKSDEVDAEYIGCPITCTRNFPSGLQRRELTSFVTKRIGRKS